MRPKLAEIITSYAESRRFVQLARGSKAELGNGNRANARLVDLRRSVRPLGLRLARFSYECRIQMGSTVGLGFGEANSKLVAVQKCLAEGFERAVFKSFVANDPRQRNSNGWAAHLNEKKARRSALEELVERDGVLVHWLTRAPMAEIFIESGPVWLRDWAARELPQGTRFKTLRVLVAGLGYLPVVTTILSDASGRAVLSHATADTLERAVFKALVETCRIGQIALERTFIRSAKRLKSDQSPKVRIFPEDHALFYAHHEPLPTWIFGDAMAWTQCAAEWKKKTRAFWASPIQHEFHSVAQGPLTVGYCTSDRVQSLYFGGTERARRSGILNVRRLRAVRRGGGRINLQPHCIA